MAEKKKRPAWEEVLIQLMSGGSAGFIEVSLMHPLDLVKTRLQLQNNVAKVKPGEIEPIRYNGVIDCFVKMYKHEGIFSYWKGIVPPILAETPKRAVKFATFEQYKRLFMFGKDKATPGVFALAGACAGATEGVVVNPFEVVKVAQQANRAKSTESPSTMQMTKMLYKTEGPLVFYKGVSATVARSLAFNCIYFGLYHSIKDHYPAYEDTTKEFFRKVALGFTAGVAGSTVNIPFDVAKSRIQGPQPVPGEVKYKGTVQTMSLVAKEEGFLALYKGLLPKVLRLGPGGAIMLLAFEYINEYLNRVL